MTDAMDRTHDEADGARDDHDHDEQADEARAEDIVRVAMAAAQLRQGAKVVELQESPHVPGATTLLAWGYFNPFGPTACRVDALPVADTGETLLVSASDHPMYPDYHAIALIPPTPDLAAALRDALAPIFAANGGGGEWGLVGSVPSYVHLLPDSPVDYTCTAELLRSAIAAAGGSDYIQEIHDLLRAWRDPWGQAAEAVNRSLEGPAAQRLLAQIRKLQAVESWPPHEEHEAEEDQVDDADADDLFDLWFALATRPAYVERIEGQMGIAWTGAQAFQSGAFF